MFYNKFFQLIGWTFWHVLLIWFYFIMYTYLPRNRINFSFKLNFSCGKPEMIYYLYNIICYLVTSEAYTSTKYSASTTHFHLTLCCAILAILIYTSTATFNNSRFSKPLPADFCDSVVNHWTLKCYSAEFADVLNICVLNF